MRMRNLPRHFQPKPEAEKVQMHQVNARLTVEDHKRLKDLAEDAGLKISRYAQKILENHIKGAQP